MPLTSEAKKEVESLLQAGQKIKAIQYLNQTFNISEQDSTKLIVALEREMAINTGTLMSSAQSATTLDGPLKTEVVRLLQNRRKLEAVKYVQNHLNIGLNEALMMVEEVEKEINPNYKSFNPTGCLRRVAKGVGIIFGVVGIIFLGSGGITFYFQSQSIDNSDLVTATVIEMQYLESGSAPVVEFEWKGEKRSYQSNTYSTTPDYQVNDTVSLYISREDPNEIVLNTFMERYALIVGLGVIGTVLSLISLLFLYFANRKF